MLGDPLALRCAACIMRFMQSGARTHAHTQDGLKLAGVKLEEVDLHKAFNFMCAQSRAPFLCAPPSTAPARSLHA